MARLSAKAGTMPHSGIRSIGALAARIPDAIRLELGDPDFNTPAHVIDAAARAAHEGRATKYTPTRGTPRLRELCARKVEERNGFACSPEEVVVTAGGCGGLFNSLLTLLDPGDEVLVPDPGWSNYPGMVHVLGATVVRYPLDPEREFAPDLDALGAAITPRAKVILVNSPGNPTGAVYDREILGGVVELARRHDLWILSDECYDELVFEGEHVSVAAVAERDPRVVTVFTFSKSYAMTGWRIGYTVAAPEVANAIERAQEAVIASVSGPAQAAAEAALTGPQDVVAQMRDAYRERRDLAIAKLDAAGVGYVRPRGAFYLMVDVSAAGEPSHDFATRLLEEQHVCVVPGSAFGPGGEGMVRICLSVAPDAIAAGLDGLAAALAVRAPA